MIEKEVKNLKKKSKKKIVSVISAIILLVFLSFVETLDEKTGNVFTDILNSLINVQSDEVVEEQSIKDINGPSFDLNSIPEYTGSPYVVINSNKPYFKDEDLVDKSFERYANLDQKGRCGVAIASVGKDIMPTEKRGAIGSVKPSGWQNTKYDNVNGRYLYNRCHLIGYQLTAENANEKNLITGTRYLNIEGMLPFENMVADYVKETNNHVLYRVTPIFKGDDLVASGVLMEAKSVEDNGEAIEYNVYCYNVQPGIEIDYSTGESFKK